MNIAAYFQLLAQRCYKLALGCFDLGTAGKLNAMGDELAQKSRELDSREFPLQPEATRRDNLKNK
jgi:hypothetical protein